MSINTVNYFHRASLRQRFLDGLDDAAQARRLTADERVWLQCLAHDPDEDDLDPLRVDRLVFSDGARRPFELTATLMLSHGQTDDPHVYLFSLANGVEAFEDRRALLAVLRERFAGGADTLFEYEKIEGNPFRAQMLAIVDQQVEAVGQMTTQLSQIPSLLEASTASLTRELQRLLPHMPLDPVTHVLQIAPIDDGDAEPDLVVQTLAQAAFDDSCKVTLDVGYERRFLDTRGLLATTADSALFHQAFTAAHAGLEACHRELLTAYWRATVSGPTTRRALAIEGFVAGLRRELYDHRNDGTLHVDTLNALLPVLQLPSGTVGGDLRCHRLSLKAGDGPACPMAATFLVKPANGAEGQILWFSPDHRLLHFADLSTLTGFLSTAAGRDRLRPALALADQAVLDRVGALQIELEEIQLPLCAERVDSVIAQQARNLAFARRQTCASEQLTAMLDDALDVRALLDPRQLAFGSGRWCEGVSTDFAQTWLKHEAATVPAEPMIVPVIEAAPEPVAQVSEGVNSSEPVPAGELTEPAPEPADKEDETPAPLRSLTASWVEYAQAFDARAGRLQQLDNVLIQSASHTLQRYLCVLFDGYLPAQSFKAQWLESGPADTSDVEGHSVSVSESLHVVTLDLVSLLLECVSGHRSAAMHPSTRLKVDAMVSMGALETDLINHVLTEAVRAFDQRYVEAFKQSRLGVQRKDDQHSTPYQVALSIRDDAIRLDLSLAKRQARIDSIAVTLVRQVLDRPIRGLRLALGVPVTEAYSVSFAHGDQPAASLCDTLVLRQPLNPDSPVLLWSCEVGWRQFASIERMEATVRYNVQNDRERWLQLLSEEDRRALQAKLSNATDSDFRIELTRLDGHTSRALQDRMMTRQHQDLQLLCRRARRCRFEAGLFTRLASATELDDLLIGSLDGLSVRIDNSIFEAMLPSWVSEASIAELVDYYNIFKRYYQNSDDGRDFLFGIPSLQDLARQRLTETLKRDFPAEAFDPDQITVTSRRYITALPATGELPSGVPAATEVRTESLIDYAINRFVDAQDAALSVHYPGPSHRGAALTPDYLRSLVRSVNVGAAYTTLLRNAFNPTEPHYAARQRLFIGQLPSALMSVALPDKVQDKLSATAYEFIARVLDMPDGIAREPIGGAWVILSQLQLVADEGMTPDPVTGVYLICSTAPDAGPVVLYAVYHEAFVFREYANREALQTAIRTDASLQPLLLERLAPDVHRRYAHGGFIEPHLPFSTEAFNELPVRVPGPVTLNIAEIKGNALQTLFAGTLDLLVAMGTSNSVTNAQADDAGRRFLATLALSQALTLLPSKLASLVTLWQSHTLFRNSAVSASRHRWGKALSEFTSALGLMVTAQQQSLEEPPQGGAAAPLAEVAEEEAATSSFSWGRTTLTPEQRVRLQGLEAQNVALNEMRHDELLNLYFDREDETPYSVVAGRVYQVKRLAERGEWMIVGSDNAPGPKIVLDSNQRWQLDLDLRLRGGGGAVTRFLDTASTASAESGMVIEASGMAEIRQAYRYRARRIAEAHSLARQYLENCLDNLNARQADGTLDPRVAGIVGEFFGTASPEQALLTRVQVAVKALLDGVMAPSLSPFSSTRFVIGTNRPGRGHVTAFIIPMDPQHRVFLTDRFFRPPRFRLKPAAALEGFETTPHFQASTLIHELSHWVLDTKDIAYLESNAPYPDLLREDTAANVRMRAQIERMQDYRLSHRTPKKDLFTQEEDGHWRDVRRDDALGYSSILRITGAKTLDEARTVFLADVDKRSQVMLKNADSVGLMILRLGRRNYTALNP
ncbi:dermonecrotic toxin domain-containing protein [Pseudomonas sp. NPDC088368]|uniref:dermonecrotic toxin domain-containing protein n=1 Tax=Pseudomonas sp. NPDC088368 TaxID=3364453 RepID=UPI003818F990